MERAGTIMGLDVGSTAVGLVLMDRERTIVYEDYRFHNGDVRATLARMLHGRIRLDAVERVAATASTPRFVTADCRYDNQLAVIAAARHFCPEAAALLNVGAEKFSLALFDGDGRYRGSRANTSCAAGTGAFLDQQAARLGLRSTGQLSEMAHACADTCPKIASRCAVFAKTDLIHAQQEGFRLDAISDGLCRGLAKNIVDSLFGADVAPGVIVFCGGVSRNRAVAEHIGELTGRRIVVPERSHLFGALGVCLSVFEDSGNMEARKGTAPVRPEDLFSDLPQERSYFYDPLELRYSDYPDFSSEKSYLYEAGVELPVEVDIYSRIDRASCREVYLGIDVGSTSTKAVLIDRELEVLAGLYTRTAGRPLEATQAIFRAVAAIEAEHGWSFSVRGCGTTGSGRKFIGAIVGADLVVDEITAHARAATQLDPKVDTIIEIGGQDAKFTTLSGGRVTASVMNTVCAAGTGSFIEEQAAKLGCPLSEYSSRTAGIRAPMASDRCTVFMERDINHLLSEGYSVNEVLAAALHSVRENYLLKVATEKHIGTVVFFQGATAKNRSLVAAFEQRLKKPIVVSPFCHLTGALGSALVLVDEMRRGKSRFRGISLYKKEIPVTSEVCDYCSNHCKLSVARVDGETEAYGFLCGRDYETKRHVRAHRDVYDLQRERRSLESGARCAAAPGEIRIGLPAAVHLFEDLFFWRRLFSHLGIETVVSDACREGLKRGTYLSRAEFCAPMTAMHGHVSWLLERTDYVFLPAYLEEKSRGNRRQYCYYTQYLPSLASLAVGPEQQRVLRPVVRYLYTSFHTRMQLYRMLQGVSRRDIGFLELSRAYDRALVEEGERRERLQNAYRARRAASGDDIGVVFLGRPYNVLSNELNSNIPALFNNLGIDTFYQDMVPRPPDSCRRIRPLLDELHWRHAARILEAAETVGPERGVYPVFLTSFKCSPDSFALDYFKRIMAHHRKPYLILELDEHDSRVGYETRVEAAVRSFRNHFAAKEPAVSRVPAPLREYNDAEIGGKTLVFPNWDPICCSFLVSVLQREGVDAVLMEETDQSIRQSLKHNTGQCIPLNAVAQGYMNTITTGGFDPARTLLWLNESYLACNIRLYPYHIRSILAEHGYGAAGTYLGNLSFSEISLRAVKESYFAYYFGGMLRKICCRIRPYELYPGETDRVLGRAVDLLNEAFRSGADKERVLDEIVTRFAWIETKVEARPKVAIFGDLYCRDNRIFNQDLIRFIERHGGEAITTPYSEYAKMIAMPYFRKWFNEGNYLDVLSNSAALAAMKQMEKHYRGIFNRVLEEPDREFNDPPAEILSRFNVAIENTGESMDNLLKVHYTVKHYPDVALFVQASPSLCCASLITEAMREKIEEVTGVPVVSITYDGTGGSKNECVIPYLRYPRVRNGAAADSEPETMHPESGVRWA